MARRLWLLRMAVVCVVLALLLSVESVDAAKKKKKSQKKAEVVTETPAAATGGYTATPAATISVPTPTPTPVPTPAAVPTPTPAAAPTAEEIRDAAAKAEIARKRAEKRAAALLISTKAARARNAGLAQRRKAKVARLSRSRAAAKVRAEELVAKKRAADTPEIRSKGHDKLRWLAAQAAKSSTHMISMDASNFHKYVNEGPRPYFLMLQFTALTSSHNCHYCHLANAAIMPVAAAHYERTKAQTEFVLASNSTADIADADLPVFFVNIEMARNGELFKELKLQSAPNMMLAPPRLSTNTLRGFDFIKTLPGRYRFNLQASMQPSDFGSFINKNARINLPLDAPKPTFMELLSTLIVLGLIAVAGLRWGLTILLKVREFKGIKWFILIVGCGLYCWCIGGGMYNIIRQTQFSGGNRDGSTNYINGDARDQFSAEGYIIGALNLACAAALVFVNTLSFEETQVGGKQSAAATKQLSPMQNLKNAVMPYLSSGVCLIAFVFVWSRIVGIYNMKNPGYRLGFVWRI